MVLRKQKEGAGTCRFSVDLQNRKTIRITLIWYNIIAVSGYQNETQRDTGIAERQIQFRRKSASSSSECLCLLSSFFFGAPAAEACARMIVESMRIPEMAPAS